MTPAFRLLPEQGGLVVVPDHPVQVAVQVADGLPGQDEVVLGGAVPHQLQGVLQVLGQFLADGEGRRFPVHGLAQDFVHGLGVEMQVDGVVLEEAVLEAAHLLVEAAHLFEGGLEVAVPVMVLVHHQSPPGCR